MTTTNALTTRLILTGLTLAFASPAWATAMVTQQECDDWGYGPSDDQFFPNEDGPSPATQRSRWEACNA